jgi:hypothetical protein
VSALEANRKHIQTRFTQIRPVEIDGKLKTLWHIDPLLGNDGETIEATAVTRHQPERNNGNIVRRDDLYLVRSEAISHDRTNSVSVV